jgi:hypothetical protein
MHLDQYRGAVARPGRGRVRGLAVAALAALGLIGCEGVLIEEDTPTTTRPGQYESNSLPGDPNRQTVFGTGGLFTGKKKPPGESGSGGIGVNSFLWRASLDTMAFMPLASADPFGGVIITDWYAPPETPDERFKVTIYILDRQLRADAVRVAVFRERRSAGTWTTAAVEKETATRLEDAILTRARELRVASGGS